jgi:hypothetical protein
LVIVISVTESEGVMDRALHSIEETGALLGGIARDGLYHHVAER